MHAAVPYGRFPSATTSLAIAAVITSTLALAGCCGGSAGVEPTAEAAASDSSAITAAITEVLTTQAEAWNRGDIDAFVDHYWKSDDLTFSAAGKTNRGWTATRNRYRERYPTPERMGQLTFSDLEITPLADAAALVLGQWKLQRQPDPVGGNFTLILRKLDGRWLIVHDHTSQRTE